MVKLFYSELQKLHAPNVFLQRGQLKPCNDSPQRLESLLAGAEAAGLILAELKTFGFADYAKVHSPGYLDFLANGYLEWSRLEDSSEQIMPNVHPSRPHTSCPNHIVGRAGWYMGDCASAIGKHTWTSVKAAADTALSAATALIDGESAAYSLCRPPGHHAYADQAMGHCFLNNAAIAVEKLKPHFPRIAVIDIDVHHGNGTQSIFYSRSDVYTVSIHADPSEFYPFFWGYSHETGEGPGNGFNLNLPLPIGATESQWLSTMENAIKWTLKFGPDAIVVALGLDAFEQDPLGAFRVDQSGFAAAGKQLASTGIPTLLIQEGGYLTDQLGANLTAVLQAFQS